MSEWNEYLLADLGTFSNGINKDKDSFGYGTPFVNLLDVFEKDTITCKPLGLIKVNNEELIRYNLINGDIIFVRSSVKIEGVGKVSVILEDLEDTIFSGFLIRFRQKKEIIDALFASYYFNSSLIRSQIISKGTLSANSNINQESLKKVRVKIPANIRVQQKIAKILNTCDILIERTVETISKYQAIKQGKLQNLFTRGLDTNGKLRPTYQQVPELYKESELGIIPKEWIVSCFGDNSQTYAGGTPSRSREDYFCGNIPWISSSEVNQDYIKKTKEHITQEALDNSSAKRIPKNAILIALYGATAGQVSKLLIDASANQAVLACLGSSTLLEDYIYYLFDFSKERLLFKAQGSGQPNLSKELVDKLEVVIPDKIEQEGIVKRLNSIDQKIKYEVNIMQKYKSIKQGLMNDLLTGKKIV